MGKRIGISAFILLVLSIFVFQNTVNGQEYEYKEYTVLKGDTLWDISSKEVKDPFLWPKIWKENPDIKDPDHLHPSQKIRIPLSLMGKEIPEETTAEKAAPSETEISKETEVAKKPEEVAEKITPEMKRYLADADFLASTGYITDYISKEGIKSVGKIAGSPSGRTLFGKEDIVFLSTGSPGDKFYIIRSDRIIVHPQTKVKMGHMVEVLGVAEVIGVQNGDIRAKITKSFLDIRLGDLLDAFYSIEPIIGDETDRKPDVSGLIVATRALKKINAFMDVVFIDKGSKDGLETGDLLKAVIIDKKLMSKASGIVKIIGLKDATSAAIVLKSEFPVGPGDTVAGLK